MHGDLARDYDTGPFVADWYEESEDPQASIQASPSADADQASAVSLTVASPPPSIPLLGGGATEREIELAARLARVTSENSYLQTQNSHLESVMQALDEPAVEMDDLLVSSHEQPDAFGREGIFDETDVAPLVRIRRECGRVSLHLESGNSETLAFD